MPTSLGDTVIVFGTLGGYLNDFNLWNVNLNALTTLSSGILSIKIIPIVEELGDILRILPTFFGLLAWMFTKPDSDADRTGFDITGDRFLITTVIKFDNNKGEIDLLVICF